MSSGKCLHPSVIAYDSDDLKWDPPRCWDCGYAVHDPDREDEAERQVFLAWYQHAGGAA